MSYVAGSLRRISRSTLDVRSQKIELPPVPPLSRPCINSAATRRSAALPAVKERAFSNTPRFRESTICALSTAPGRAAIAIIRLSGPACLYIYRTLCPEKTDPKPRYATLRTLYAGSGEAKEVLDSDALVLYFPAPRTVTGEDVLELHVHGGPAVVQAVLSAIARCDVKSDARRTDIRYAEPGEFTRRAFLNDRLDLTQVEALGDILSATTEQQRRLFVRGTTGTLAKQYEKWRKQLLYARGELEALIDFSEDQHFDESPSELCSSVAQQVRVLQDLLRVHLQNAVRGELLRNGISISLLGAPNAGKSSLLNRIVGREAAIVSHEAGTTRDVVEIGLDIGGYLCRLGDTAGLRNTAQPSALHTQQTQSQPTSHQAIGAVEQEGMRRAKARAANSDVVILVLSFEPNEDDIALHLDPEVQSTAQHLSLTKSNIIAVLNKSDLATPSQQTAAVQRTMEALHLPKDRVHLISCASNHPYASTDQSVSGPTSASSTATHKHAHAYAHVADQHPSFPADGNIPSFLSGLIAHFHALTAAAAPDGSVDPSIWQESLGASERHRVLLQRCLDALEEFMLEVQPEVGEDGDGEGEADIVVAAEHLRTAAECLAKITGRGEAGDVDEVLGVVFEKFCVGK